MSSAATPGQTVGPFFGIALPREGGEHLVPPGTPGAVRLTGRVLDGEGAPVPDALLEIAPGHLLGRAASDADGRYVFTTPRPEPPAHGLPFFAVVVFARGLLDRLFTRIYLPAPPDRLATDPLLARLDSARRDTLVATADGDTLLFDVHLQGERETVFLTFPGHTR
jgi:protocatechuate 3,4-dioxygenase alpha subunit